MMESLIYLTKLDLLLFVGWMLLKELLSLDSCSRQNFFEFTQVILIVWT